MKILRKIKRFFKSFFLNKEKTKISKYYSYVNTMLNSSKVFISNITSFEYIDTISKINYPISYDIKTVPSKKLSSDVLDYLHVNTVCSIIEFYCYANKINIKKVNTEHVYLYLLIKLGSTDSPITIKEILKALKYFGFKEFNKKTIVEHLTKSKKEKDKFIKIGNYFSVENMNFSNIPEALKRNKIMIMKIKDCLCKETPVLIGLELYNKFTKLTKAKLQKQKYKGSNDKHDRSVGLYPFIITGYNDEKRYFKVYAGWGDAFGDNGYFKIDYDVLLKDVKEIWYITNLNQIKKGFKNDNVHS